MKANVHVYALVRFRFDGIEGDSFKELALKARKCLDGFIADTGYTQGGGHYAEEVSDYVIDILGPDGEVKGNQAVLDEYHVLRIMGDTKRCPRIQGETMADYEKAVEENLKGIEAVSTGLNSECGICLVENNCTAEEIENGSMFDEGGLYRNQSCEGCGTSLSQNLYTAHGLMDDKLVHLFFCEDCVFYINNGDIPEHWEG